MLGKGEEEDTYVKSEGYSACDHPGRRQYPILLLTDDQQRYYVLSQLPTESVFMSPLPGRKIDVEISEPIDFSSGDHQHLVRKVAGRNIHSKSGELSSESTSSESQNMKGNPHSKASERADTYVVQVSDDTTPEASSAANLASPFSDTSIRRDSLKGGMSIVKFKTAFYSFYLPVATDMCMVSIDREKGHAHTRKILLEMGELSQIQHDYLKLFGDRSVTGKYLVMDVQLMVGGRHHHSDLDPEEYIFAALNIYLDIINLFLFILQLIGLGR
ncbi:Farnesyl pyrophosphate synthase [Tupaia chinensis]|uniref:(2E,6E)-farnesyl diphosphate synthase n=1 Tax=Tupaia chinensis TaxID=246437 RepID=L9K2E6_TUPCH|nr:Farnesyl pyrophosphate synthase [Tupaia chinensis]